MIRDNIIKKVRNQFIKNNFLNLMSPLTRSKIFPFSTKAERVLELERNTNIDKIMKHKIFVNNILIFQDSKTYRAN